MLAKVVSGTVTGVFLVCAVAVTAVTVRRELRGSERPRTGTFEAVDDKTLGAAGHRIGPANARAVLVEFADFQCGACKLLAERIAASRVKFPDDFAVVYRHMPLSTIHPVAVEAAVASECAGRQGRFEAMHHALFENQDSLHARPWVRLAKRAALPNLQAFRACMADSTARGVVDRDVEAASKLRARGTPTGVINGVKFTGAIPQTVLDSLVESAVRVPRSPSS